MKEIVSSIFGQINAEITRATRALRIANQSKKDLQERYVALRVRKPLTRLRKTLVSLVTNYEKGGVGTNDGTEDKNPTPEQIKSRASVHPGYTPKRPLTVEEMTAIRLRRMRIRNHQGEIETLEEEIKEIRE